MPRAATSSQTHNARSLSKAKIVKRGSLPSSLNVFAIRSTSMKQSPPFRMIISAYDYTRQRTSRTGHRAASYGSRPQPPYGVEKIADGDDPRGDDTDEDDQQPPLHHSAQHHQRGKTQRRHRHHEREHRPDPDALCIERFGDR